MGSPRNTIVPIIVETSSVTEHTLLPLPYVQLCFGHCVFREIELIWIVIECVVVVYERERERKRAHNFWKIRGTFEYRYAVNELVQRIDLESREIIDW